jgi:hypothetical protein
MAHLTIDTSVERFGARTSIAHLAANSFPDWDANHRDIYQAESLLRADWRDEIEALELEYLVGVSCMFPDGSKIHVAAWADCCADRRCKHCAG